MSSEKQYPTAGKGGQRDEKDLKEAIRYVDEAKRLTDVSEIKQRLEQVSTLLAQFQA